jgi:hypothetical protein
MCIIKRVEISINAVAATDRQSVNELMSAKTSPPSTTQLAATV